MILSFFTSCAAFVGLQTERERVARVRGHRHKGAVRVRDDSPYAGDSYQLTDRHGGVVRAYLFDLLQTARRYELVDLVGYLGAYAGLA